MKMNRDRKLKKRAQWSKREMIRRASRVYGISFREATRISLLTLDAPKSAGRAIESFDYFELLATQEG